MQISIDKINNITRKVDIAISAEQLSKMVSNQIKKIGKDIKINGFRPGHVPSKLIQEKYGFSIYQEAIENLLDDALNKAISEHDLDPIGDFELKNINKQNEDQNFDLNNLSALNCTFEVEVYPEVEFKDFKDFKIKTPEIIIKPEDVTAKLLEIRKKFGHTIVVDRAAKESDILTIDYVGKIDDKEFPNGTGKDLTVEIGSGLFIEGFEEGLIGYKADDLVTLNLKFPENYAEATIAGKQVTFEIKVKKVSEKKLAELDEKLAKNMHLHDGDIEKINDEIKQNLEEEVKDLIYEKESQEVIDLLLQNYPVEIPEKLLKTELDNLKYRFINHNKNQGIDINKLSDNIIDTLKIQATKNVQLSLLLRCIVKQNNLQVDSKIIQEKMHEFDQYFNKIKDSNKIRARFQNNLINSNLAEIALRFVSNKITKIPESMSFAELKIISNNN